MNNQQIMYNLILRTFIPHFHLISEKGIQMDKETIQSSIKK